jgi:hypothetical protein
MRKVNWMEGAGYTRACYTGGVAVQADQGSTLAVHTFRKWPCLEMFAPYEDKLRSVLSQGIQITANRALLEAYIQTQD